MISSGGRLFNKITLHFSENIDFYRGGIYNNRKKENGDLIKMGNILSCFKEKKPIIGVIHAKGTNDEDMMERAVSEINTYIENGIDGILVETYFGTYHQVRMILDYLRKNDFGVPYGVNCLNVDAMGFVLANEYGCKFIQLDSVIGHVKPRDEESLSAFLEYARARCDAYVMGGVRFKYQPVLSEKSTEEDLITAKERCDAVCVTEDATGQETSLGKIMKFRDTLGDFPLFVCAGVTPKNVAEQLKYADGAVVGSYFKDNHKDTGDVYGPHVAEIMDIVRKVRK